MTAREAQGSTRGENIEEQLHSLIWKGEYKKAVPLAQRLFRDTSRRDYAQALMPLASVYYSYAGTLAGNKEIVKSGKYYLDALALATQRLEIAQGKRWQTGVKTKETLEAFEKKAGSLIKTNFDTLSTDELDVVAAIFAQTGERLKRIPGSSLTRSKKLGTHLPFRNLDAVALGAIRTGLKRFDKGESASHAEIFMLSNQYKILARYGSPLARTYATEFVERGSSYEWPVIEVFDETQATTKLASYGQAARVARAIAEAAEYVYKDNDYSKALRKKAERYAMLAPDQKSRLKRTT